MSVNGHTPLPVAIKAQNDSRPAVWRDVGRVCTLLQQEGVQFCLHGGFAIDHWIGSGDYTGDIDIAIPRKLSEFEKMRKALGQLPKHKMLRHPAALLIQKVVIRLIEDFCVDVITNIGGIEFGFLEILPAERQGLTIPMVSADCLVRIKQFVVRRDPKHLRDLHRLQAAGYNGNYTGRALPISASPARTSA